MRTLWAMYNVATCVELRRWNVCAVVVVGHRRRARAACPGYRRCAGHGTGRQRWAHVGRTLECVA